MRENTELTEMHGVLDVYARIRRVINLILQIVRRGLTFWKIQYEVYATRKIK